MPNDAITFTERFLEAVQRTRSLGAGTNELSYYPALQTLFDDVGGSLSPKVLALSNLEDTGAGHPDFGLFAAKQVQRGEPRSGQMPERGAVEVKGVADDSLFTGTTGQLSKYYEAYGLVLVTNLRGWQLVERGLNGEAVRLEAFSLADDAAGFWAVAATPRKSARTVGPAFVEYLRRALSRNVALVQPKEVAWFLASYARDALARVEAAGELAALATVRSALEDALGIRFEEEKGDRFFRSTLVQTLFYGLFSAWVIWARDPQKSAGRFDWRTAGWTLNVPFVSTLFQQLTVPQQLKPLGLTEVLDWTGDTLNRIEAGEFLDRFDGGEAVQYFYEPFLEAFDPVLRKQFGVWYTPGEIVDYMVARVDRALKDELGIADGLADERVYVLDPCCGTGGFVTAVLRRIRNNLAEHGLGDAVAGRVRRAARERVFGFEIMPAPFVVAHLQTGLALANMKAPLGEEERPAIYLTNALTGWEPHDNKPLPFPELEQERASADAVKQQRPILVVLGNPPYDGFAGVSQDAEERALTDAYRTVKRVAAPQGQGLNELYVRFFRMAERRIVQTGEGVVAFISNYSWLDGLSFTGMRERYLETFDTIAIDCLNGDKYKTGKTTPDGDPDPSIFSTRANPAGIQVGTAIATMVRKPEHHATEEVLFRDLWGTAKRETLAATAEDEPEALYQKVSPELKLRLPFAPVAYEAGYLEWPLLPDLLPVGLPGVKTSRDEFLVDIDRDALERRIARYFDEAVADVEIGATDPIVMQASKRFDPRATRKALLTRKHSVGKLIRYAYRPFDVRWAYYDPDTKLLDEKRPEFIPHALPGAMLIEAREKEAGSRFARGSVVGGLADNFGNGLSTFFPAMLDDGHGSLARPNLRQTLDLWRTERGLAAEDVFLHCVATLHSPAYRRENDGALRIDWPRVPMPSDAESLRSSAALGERLVRLLDVDRPMPGVGSGALLAGLSVIAVPRGVSFALTVGWGHTQTNKTGSRVVMPGGGRTTVRAWSDHERSVLTQLGERYEMSLQDVLDIIGHTAVDVSMNDAARWTGVPSLVWDYTLGGYQVLKKWLSYREEAVLGRALNEVEATEFAAIARRITEILCLGPVLDDAHLRVRQCAVPLVEGRPG